MTRFLAILMLALIHHTGICQTLMNMPVHSDATQHQCMTSLAAARDASGVIHIAVVYRNSLAQGATGSGFQRISHWYTSNEGSSWTGGDSLLGTFGGQPNDPHIVFDPTTHYA